MVYSHMKYSDKAFMGSVTHPERAKDTVEMAKILFGDGYLDPITGRPKTVIVSLINVNSPMTYDMTMLGALKVYARANQACIVTPFILAGAMSPVTVAGTATQTLAEALAGMAFIQLLNPGAPMVFGSFASSLSMQSGAPTFGTPEPALVLYVMAHLARRLGCSIPFGRQPLRLEDPGRAGRVRIGADPAARPALPASTSCCTPAGWLEGGPRHGLREVRHGRGPGRDDAHAAGRR
jgi:trimethylamine--corrinoid protein Co-methyltransferase